MTLIRSISLLLILAVLPGCATTHSAEENDPLQSYNRAMYQFNDTLDTAILKPIAIVYDAITPDPISHAISNVFSNLGDITVVLNDLLQFKFAQAGSDLHRLLVNSTVGVGGIFDVASLSGIEKHHEDFGQTLGYWGVPSGAYVVLPFFGPSTLRDTVGLVGDSFSDPIAYIDHVPTRNEIIAHRVVDQRAGLFKAEKVLDAAAIDEYSYIREGYLQRRQNLVFDGKPPEVDDEDFDLFSE